MTVHLYHRRGSSSTRAGTLVLRKAFNLPGKLAWALSACFLLFASGASHAGERLDAIKLKGFVTCGIGANVPGFSQRDAQGAWHGFDVDMCKAIAAAIFGDAGKIRFKPIDTLVS